MRLERRRRQAVRLSWRASAALAQREPYLWRARPRLRHLAAFNDLVLELVWAARRGGLWVDSTGSQLVAYRSGRARWRSWWLAGVTFALVLPVLFAAAFTAEVNGIDGLVVFVGALVLMVVGAGGRPGRTWRSSRDAGALRDQRRSLGPHTYISFVFKPSGRSARSPIDIAIELQGRGELVGPYVAQAGTPAHVRLYRRYGFVPVSTGTEAAGRPASRLMMLKGDLLAAAV